jgi:prepilin-type processing-associated H-X9-DG protein
VNGDQLRTRFDEQFSGQRIPEGWTLRFGGRGGRGGGVGRRPYRERHPGSLNVGWVDVLVRGVYSDIRIEALSTDGRITFVDKDGHVIRRLDALAMKVALGGAP